VFQITLEKAEKLLQKKKKSLIKFVKESHVPPSQELKEWVETLEISINLIKREIEKNG